MNDLISRQAAIDALHTWFRDGFEEDKWWNSTHVLAALEGVPSAQPTMGQVFDDDCVSRRAAIDAIYHHLPSVSRTRARTMLHEVPSAQPRLNKKRISDLLWNEYRTMSPHLSAEGVVARRYYCKELWKELFGEEETPVWMTW